MEYQAVNLPIVKYVPSTARRILDIGCGTGALGAYIKSKLNCEVIGVTFSEEEAKVASVQIDSVKVIDLNHYQSASLGFFDLVICSHVLEHLYDPDIFLRKVKENMGENSVLIVALPNVVYWKQRINFLKGRFRYSNGGLMDRTHFRFYDLVSAEILLTSCGYSIHAREVFGSFPLPVFRKLLPTAARWIDSLAIKIFPGLFGVQFIFACQK